ncbi:hypothetical protein JCM13304A_18710 [Desulfothermus okinawensis JCM 13304]
MKDNKYKYALKEITDVIKFEMWLRFYFASQGSDPNTVILKVPEEVMEHIEQEYDILFELAKELNNKKITPETSQKAVTNFILRKLEGKKFPPAMVPSVLNSKSFEIEVSVFHLWVSAHEDQLDEKVFDFKEWMQLFEAWKRTEKGQNVLSTLHSPGARTSDTTQ